MNQICKVCGEPAAGFHFGAFTCEGCKSFFGRSYNNLSSISECKNSGKCIIDKKNRTTCKACRLRKCYTVGMSKGGSRYGRRSNWFKIHCLLQEQQQQAVEAAGKAAGANGYVGDMAQHLQQRSNAAHMSAAAQHMGSLLGYPGYLPEMSPFLSAAAAAAATRHSATDASAAAAALPFFSMMNGAPPPHQSAFQLPPHLLFPGYHPYRSEMFAHRQSVDSAESAQSRYSPAARSTHSASSVNGGDTIHVAAEARQSPLLCVAGDDEDTAAGYEHTQRPHSHSAATSPVSSMASSMSHRIHSPIAQREEAITSNSPLHSIANITAASNNNKNTATVVTMTPPASQPRTPEPQQSEVSPATTMSQTLSFVAKMQSLSPVSVCSISAETASTVAAAADQDCPMDLSMKTPRSSVQSCNNSVSGGAEESDNSNETAAAVAELRQASRRKFYQLNDEHDESDDASSLNADDEHRSGAVEAKRQKFVAEQQQQQQQSSYSNFTSNPTSLRGIFVCV